MLLGTVPDARYAPVEGFAASAEEITIGADTWHLFPFLKAGSNMLPLYSGDVVDSGLLGVAYKEVP